MLIIIYHNSIKTDDNYTISVDNIVFDTRINLQSDREALMRLVDKLSYSCANVTHWESGKMGFFKDNFRFVMEDGTSFWLGVGLNLKKTDWGRIRLDWNPNKVAKHEALKAILFFLVNSSKEMHREIKRFDLAIDIPVERSDCFMIKDSRCYIERRHGREWTQYLGAKSSTVGRTKLYNKQVEARLGQPLTRLELTLSPDISYEELNFPKVYYIKNRQLRMNELRTTDTEQFILNSILQGCGTTKELGRKMREKVEVMLKDYVEYVVLRKEDYLRVLAQLETYRMTGQT